MQAIERRLQALEKQNGSYISPETRAEVARIVEELQNRKLSPEQERREREQLERALAEIENRYCR